MTINVRTRVAGSSPYLPADDNGGFTVTEEKARLDFLKGIEIDKTLYIAMQEIEFIFETIKIVRNSLKDDHNKSLSGLQCLDGYNFKDSYIQAVGRVWNILFGNMDNAMSIFLSTDSISNIINPNTVLIMKKMVLDDIKSNPVEWINTPKIDGLARYYIEKPEKPCSF